MKALIQAIGIASPFALTAPALSQTMTPDAASLTAQINAVSAVQDQQEARQKAVAAALQASIAHQQGLLAARQRRQDQAARASALAAAAETRKLDDFRDQQMQLELQDEKIQVQDDQTLVNRENDISDHSLKS
jgi:hypothetical protein